MGDIFQPQRRTVLPGENQIAVFGRGAQLVVGVDGHRVIFAVETAFRTVDVAVGDQRIDVFQRQLVRRQRFWIHLHANRRLITARQGHHPHAVDLRQLQRHARVHQILHLSQRQRVGTGGQRDHRTVGRIDLFIRRRIGQIVR